MGRRKKSSQISEKQALERAGPPAGPRGTVATAPAASRDGSGVTPPPTPGKLGPSANNRLFEKLRAPAQQRPAFADAGSGLDRSSGAPTPAGELDQAGGRRQQALRGPVSSSSLQPGSAALNVGLCRYQGRPEDLKNLCTAIALGELHTVQLFLSQIPLPSCISGLAVKRNSLVLGSPLTLSLKDKLSSFPLSIRVSFNLPHQVRIAPCQPSI